MALDIPVIPRALQVTPEIELAAALMRRNLKLEVALRIAIEFAQTEYDAAVTEDEKILIKDHIDFLASVETPEACRP